MATRILEIVAISIGSFSICMSAWAIMITRRSVKRMQR